jgi:hypothetical protein
MAFPTNPPASATTSSTRSSAPASRRRARRRALLGPRLRRAGDGARRERLPDRGGGPLPRARRGGARHQEPRGRRGLRATGRVLPRDRHRYRGDDRQRPRHLRRAADLVAMHAAVGDSAGSPTRSACRRLVDGWAEGCRQAGAVWGGGETPTLRGIVDPAPSCSPARPSGKIRRKACASPATCATATRSSSSPRSGVQTNGLTLCRKIADQLPQGYQTPIGHGDDRAPTARRCSRRRSSTWRSCASASGAG